MRIIARLQDTDIALAKLEPGEGQAEALAQLICIQATPFGLALAKALEPAGALVVEGGWIQVPHSRAVDATIVALIDTLAEVRRRAPRLVQLDMFSPRAKL